MGAVARHLLHVEGVQAAEPDRPSGNDDGLLRPRRARLPESGAGLHWGPFSATSTDRSLRPASFVLGTPWRFGCSGPFAAGVTCIQGTVEVAWQRRGRCRRGLVEMVPVQ